MNQQQKLQQAINNSLSTTAVNLFQKGAKPILTLGMDANNTVVINAEAGWTPELIVDLLKMVTFELEKKNESKIIVPSKIITI